MKKMLVVLVMALVAFMLSGCAHEKIWVNPNPDRNWDEDRLECREEGLRRTQPYLVQMFGSAGRNWKEYNKIWEDCLRSKGWQENGVR